MTLSLSRPLSFPLLFSGSVHLGLLILLLVQAAPAPEKFTYIELVEVPVVKGVEAIAIQTKVSNPPVPVVKDTVINEVLDAPEEMIEPASASSNTLAQELSAEELYKSQIAQELNSRKSYPPIAKRLKQQGRVIVQFNVTREGKILEAKVVQASPFKTLNQSARELVEGLKGLNPFPNEIKKTTWLFQVPVDYQM